MVDSIRQFLGVPADATLEAAPAAGPVDTRVAACALLLELAQADGDLTEDGRGSLQREVQRQFGLDAQEARQLLAQAEKARAEAVDVSQFTSVIAESYSSDQKTVLAKIMRGLVSADGELAGRGDYLLRKMSSLLRFEPGWV